MPDSKPIKFRYGYTNSKGHWIFEVYTLEEIESGKATEFLMDNPLLKDYTIGARDQEFHPSHGLVVYANDLLEMECRPSKPSQNAIRIAKVNPVNEGLSLVSVLYKKEWWSPGSMDWTTAKVIGPKYVYQDKIV